MLTLKLTPQPPFLHFESAHLTLPPQATFHHLHAALELILTPDFGSYYSFMLMTSHHAIEANTAADYKAASAFRQNPQIRYLNPNPGTFACLLELESADDREDSSYPYISGTDDDSQINTWLKEYCHFAKSWQYHNEDFFRKLYELEQKNENKRKADSRTKSKANTKTNTKTNTRTVSSKTTAQTEQEPLSSLSLKTIDQKQQIWYSTCLMHEFDGTIRVTVGSSPYSQSELLEASKKDNLANYCRYCALPIQANRKKKELAEAFASNLQENMWLTLVLLPQEAVDLYFRLCRLKENQKLSLSLEKDVEVLKLLIYLGMTDLLFQAGETDIRLELPTDYKNSFQVFFQNPKNFAPGSECTRYLSPEQKTGSWQKILKGYLQLDNRAIMLLCRYGILTVEDLWEKLCSCYGYRFGQAEFKRYLMLHMRLLEIVYTGHRKGDRQRIASLPDLNIAYALAIQEKPVPKEQHRPVKKEELDTYGDWLIEQMEDLFHLLENYVEEESMLADISQQLTYCVLQNETWTDYLELLAELLEDTDPPMHMCFWYELSKLYLHLPVAGLGGYSRMEYAKKEQLPNPYLILNDLGDYLEDWEDMGIFGMPFEVQCELYLSAECFVKDGTDLSEKRMMKVAKKYFSPKLAAALQIHCYLISGSPRLLALLEKESKRNPEALEMLNELKEMLDADD